MKKILRIVLVTSLVMAALMGGLVYLAVSQKNAKTAQDSVKRNQQLDEGATRAFTYEIQKQAEPLYDKGADRNVLVYDHADAYNTATSVAIKEQLETKGKRGKATMKKPVVAYNPFGTNENTFYFYFETNSEVSITYTITSDDSSTPDFSREVYNSAKANLSKKHEFTVGGLVPGCRNYIILEAKDSKGAILDRKVYYYDAKQSATKVKTKAVVQKGQSEETSTLGMYYVFSSKKNAIYAYDNSGVLRQEIATSTKRGKRVVVENDHIFYMIQDDAVARVNSLGQVTGVYRCNGYKLNDFDYDGYGNVYMVASRGKKHFMLRADTEKGNAVVAYRFPNKIQVNSVVFMGKGTALISANKPDGMIQLVNVASNLCKAKGVLGTASDWKSTSYRKKVMKLGGKEPVSAKQSFLMKIDGNTVSFLNNGEKDAESSAYYEYKVGNSDYKVNRKLSIDYSPSWGSGQKYQGHYIICRGTQGSYAEYDDTGKIIKEFSNGLPLRSVQKIHLNRTCFY